MFDATNVSYDTQIPNNVGLSGDRRVLKALERWHPGYIDWWKNLGPEGFQEHMVYLRTAVSVDPKGWARFDYVKMPEYRWGILLAPQVEGRTIPFGQHYGEPAWQEVPGEYRAMLRRLIVIQGDTEPASVEQQRHLGATAPSLYDLRNLFQVNVEEGRHLWAMVYLLHKYFGADGREEADGLLQRCSGSAEAPRMLGAFNEATPDWLSFFMFTFFTDRDGKMQLESLAQSGFDPLSRTCRFMLTEEAHHMFVGETGVGRTIQRTCEAMVQAGIEDPYDIDRIRALGVIDLPTIQKKLNLHFSLSLDLFGAYRDRRHAGAVGHQHATARRLRARRGGRREALERDHRQDRRGVRDEAAARGLQPEDRHLRPGQRHPGRRGPQRRRLERRPRRVAAECLGRRVHRIADEARDRAGQVRRLDRVAEDRHRQQAGRLRVREAARRLTASRPGGLRYSPGGA